MAQSTRKELKQPDQFISFTRRAWGYLQKHIVPMVALGSAVLLVAVIGVIWSHFAMARAGRATAVLAEALDTHAKPVQVSETDEETSGEQFRSVQERCERVLSSLGRLDKEHEGSDPARAGALVRAGCLLDSGKAEEAVRAYREYLAGSSSQDPFRFLAYEGLGYALESQGKYSEALAEFRLMAPEGSPLRDRAMWHEARLLERQGKKKEARTLYEQILEKFPTTELRDQIVTRSGALGE